MATKTPSEVRQEYLLHLKGLKPEVDISQEDSDWYVKGSALAGAMAGLYLDQKKVSDDPFPQRARRDGVAKHLETYFNGTFRAATKSVGLVAVTGDIGTPIVAGLQFLYQPNNNSYQSTSSFAMPATACLVPIESIGTGQGQNLLSSAPLFIPSPPAGLNASAVASGNISDGRNIETTQEAAQRVLDFIRTPPEGGTAADYKRWAFEADDSVVDCNVIRFAAGFGTVGLVITAGTTDIDAALDAGQPIVLTPSPALLAKVAAYVETKRPITDCVIVYTPVPVEVDVTVYVAYVTGSGATILTGQTLTQDQLVQREVQRAIYKTAPGGRKIGLQGYVFAEDIEQTIDLGLSAGPNIVGLLPILDDRQVGNLTVSGANLPLTGNQYPIPGTITVLGMA